MSIADNIASIQQQIHVACQRAGRSSADVQLMAVSKKHSAQSIQEAYGAGLRVFGENRVQEYASKREEFEAEEMFAADARPIFHLIGPLQSNKAARAVEIFDAIDTIDSLRLAEKLNQAAEKEKKIIPVLLEIKLSAEESKHGLLPQSAELTALLECAVDWRNLKIVGMMTVPPFAEDAELARPYFRRLREIRDALSREYPNITLDQLSMGMSHDFAVAIEEGSTCVRIGTAIFGARPM